MILHHAVFILDAQMPVTGGCSAEHAHAVLILFYLKIGVGFAINYHHITEVAIGVLTDWEAFVEKGSVGIEAAIAQS